MKTTLKETETMEREGSFNDEEALEDYKQESPEDDGGNNDWDMKITQETGPDSVNVRSNNKRHLAIGIMLLMIIAGVATTVAFLVSGKDSSESSSDTQQETNNKDPVIEIPNSYFANPSAVKWSLKGQLIQDDQPRSEGFFSNGLSISSDGTRLALGTFGRGYVPVYDYNRTLDQWVLNSRLEASEEDKSMRFGEVVTLAGDGQRLAIGGKGIVYTYDYDASTDSWLQHDQPIVEYQENESLAGFSIGFNFDGTTLAVGASKHDAQNANAGNIRIMQRGKNEHVWKLSALIHGTKLNDEVGSRIVVSEDGTTVASGSFTQNVNGIFSSGVIWVWKPNGDDAEGLEDWNKIGNPIGGMNTNSGLGGSLAMSADGRVVASVDGWTDTTIVVYEYNPSDEEWQIRGYPIPVENSATSSKGRVCLSADGNFVFAASQSTANAFQFAKSSNSWVAVGSFEADGTLFGENVACSADGRTVVTGVPLTVEGKVVKPVGKVRVFQAEEL